MTLSCDKLIRKSLYVVKSGKDKNDIIFDGECSYDQRWRYIPYTPSLSYFYKFGKTFDGCSK